MDYRLTEGDEMFWPCFYCGEVSLVYCKSDDKYLCVDHYPMHRDNDPWLDLIDLINQLLSVATPPPVPTPYPPGSLPGPLYEDTEPETHQGDEVYDA